MTSGITRFWIGVRDHRGTLSGLFVGVLIPLYVFGRLASEVVEQDPFFFDKPILLYLHGYATPALDTLMLCMSLLGEHFALIPVDIAILVWLLWQRRGSDAIFWSLAVGGAAVLNLAAKTAFGRLRPDLWLSLAPETTYSFPSGHAMGMMALVAALVVLTWSTRWRGIVLVVGGFFV